MAGRFAGKVAIVTGASRGIGLAIARQLVDEGAKVCITARKADALATAVESLGGHEVAMGIAGRADDLDHQIAVVSQTISTFGGLNFLVNNIGINPIYGSLMELDLNAARKILDVNCVGMVSWVQQAYQAWLADHGGSIVNVSSAAAHKPAPGIGFYAGSKALLGYLTAQLALELSPSIRVNAVAPAVVKTKFAVALYEGREEEVAAGYPLKRLGVPEDVSGLTAFLLSEEAAWITGQVLTIDGGLSLVSDA